MIEEVRHVLKSAELEPPYVLLGWSMGGWLSRIYYSSYPEEVAGIVLAEGANFDVALDDEEVNSRLEKAKSVF